MKMSNKWISAAAIMVMVTGCQREGSANDAATQAASDPAPQTETQSPAPTAPAERGGTIEIDGQTWNVVPAIQCGSYPGPVIAIAGHAAEDPATEISIDFDLSNLVQASVANPDGSVSWHSNDDSLEVDIEGSLISGKANFTSTSGGESKTARGTFEINCG